MNTITLNIQNYETLPELLYGDCGFSQVYLQGLKEGELIVSDQPFLIQNSNGLLVGIDQRFTQLKHVKNNTTIDTVQLHWKESCNSQTESNLLDTRTSNQPKSLIQPFGIPVILMIVGCIFTIFIYRVRRI